MSRFLEGLAAGLAVLLLANPASAEKLGLGRPALPDEIAAWDHDVSPDGTGLPAGSGSVEEGEALFGDYCAICHGDFAEGVDNWPKLAGGEGTLNRKDPRRDQIVVCGKAMSLGPVYGQETRLHWGDIGPRPPGRAFLDRVHHRHGFGQCPRDPAIPGIFVPDRIADHRRTRRGRQHPFWQPAAAGPAPEMTKGKGDAGGQDARGQHGNQVISHVTAPLPCPSADCIVRTTTNASRRCERSKSDRSEGAR